MKKIITSAMLFLAFNGFAQLVQGEINIKEQSKMELTSKSNKAVNLFADFRENKYPIHFAFTTTDVPLNSDKKEVVQFVFSTTVKKDGKIIGSIKRSPMPLPRFSKNFSTRFAAVSVSVMAMLKLLLSSRVV